MAIMLLLRSSALARLPRASPAAAAPSASSWLFFRRCWASTAASAAAQPPLKKPKTKKKRSRLETLPVLWPMPGVDAPPQLKPHEVAAVQRLFRAESKLITSTADAEGDLPEWDVPEVAFAGRSNVGKSSLLNAVAAQPGLMRTSKTPGRTQQLHFLSVGGKVGSLPDLALVDMPGHGFASAAPKKVVDEWHALVGSYVEQRRGANLKSLFLLIDARRGVTPVDSDFMDFLHDRGMVYQVVFTKADAVSVSELERNIAKAHAIAKRVDRMSMNPVVHVTSTKENFGVRELQRQIAVLSGLLVSSSA